MWYLSKNKFLFFLSITPLLWVYNANSEEFFNPDFLSDGLSSGNISASALSKFNNEEYNAPGEYSVSIYINDEFKETKNVIFKEENEQLFPCFNMSFFIDQNIDLNSSNEDAVDNECINFIEVMPGSSYEFNFAKQQLNLSIPQIYLSKLVRGTVSPTLWQEGINALFTNYSISGNDSSDNSKSLYFSLSSGLNIGSFQLRNNSSYQYNKYKGYSNSAWSNIGTYLRTPLVSLKSLLVIGDSSTNSSFFDSLSFRGMKISSSDEMYPDSQQGYAPTIRGIAKTNAKIIIKQNGYVVYQTYVPAGPFVLSDITASSSGGNLDVIIEESDNSIQNFMVPFSTIPLLQREKRFNYELIAGEFRNGNNNQSNPKFIQSSIVYGLNNTISPYVGFQYSNNYQAMISGFATNLGSFGALSTDITYARSTLVDKETYRGQSLRLLYAKSLQQTGTSLRILGYRYSTKNFYTLNDTAYKNMNGYDTVNHSYNDDDDEIYTNYYNLRYNKKGRFQLVTNQSLGSYGNIYLSGTTQTYWNSSAKDEWYQLGYNTSINNISYSMAFSRNKNVGVSKVDNLVSFNVSIPFRTLTNAYFDKDSFISNSYASLTATTGSKGNDTYQAGVGGILLKDKSLTYNVRQGHVNNQGDNGSISLGYQNSFGNYNVSYFKNSNANDINFSLDGSALIHKNGATLGQPLNDTNVLVSIPGAKGVGVQNYPGVTTNSQGYAVLPYGSPYRENRIALDIDTLPDNVEVNNNVKTVVPISGAIVQVDFTATVGIKALLQLNYKGNILPFGTLVKLKGIPAEDSIVNEDGKVYMTGLPLHGVLYAKWGDGDAEQCHAEYNFENSELTSFILQDSINCK